MHRREELLADWRRRLDELARAPRSSITRIYARVLRYLLRRYSRPEEAGGWQEPPAAEPAGLVVWTGIDLKRRRGKPPKSAAAIRAVLDKAQEANDGGVAQGTMTALSPDDWIAITSFRHHGVAQKCVWALRRAGIPAQFQGFSQPIQLFVPAGERCRALEIAEQFAEADRTAKKDWDGHLTRRERIVLERIVIVLASTIIVGVVLEIVILTYQFLFRDPQPPAGSPASAPARAGQE